MPEGEYKHTKKRKSARATTSKGMASKKYVKKAIAAEADFGIKDLIVAALTNFIGSALPVDLTEISAGDADSQRDGQVIQLKSIRYWLQCSPNTTTATACHCRMVIFYWDSLVDPTATSIFASTNSTKTADLPSVTTSRGLYRIIRDRSWNINLSGSTHVSFKGFHKLTGKTIYIGSNASDGEKRRVFMQFFSSLASNGPVLDIRSRLIFTK